MGLSTGNNSATHIDKNQQEVIYYPIFKRSEIAYSP